MELPQVTVALGADGLEPLLAAIGQLSGFPAPICETAGLPRRSTPLCAVRDRAVQHARPTGSALRELRDAISEHLDEALVT
jgi:hypothetical protein